MASIKSPLTLVAQCTSSTGITALDFIALPLPAQTPEPIYTVSARYLDPISS